MRFVYVACELERGNKQCFDIILIIKTFKLPKCNF